MRFKNEDALIDFAYENEPQSVKDNKKAIRELNEEISAYKSMPIEKFLLSWDFDTKEDAEKYIDNLYQQIDELENEIEFEMNDHIYELAHD